MSRLGDFHANGVSFGEEPRVDIDTLVERIPKEGTLHLAILQPPYLDLIVRGKKTIESRFNIKRAAPFGKISTGDLVLLKETGKPVTYYFFAASVALFDLTRDPVEFLQQEYSDDIAPQDPEAFWHARESSKYATLVEVGERGSVDPLTVTKHDQRGWVTFARDDDSLLS